MIQKINHLVNQVYHADLQTKEAEFRALQAQINPHFLYNTLDSIHWLALTRGDETISKMVTALSKLFRYTLSRNDGLITIREEIEHVRNYITIQEFRFKDRFKVWIDVDERLLPCKIVKLVVQPLVENAIVHGIERLTDGGLIALRVYEHNETIYIDVSDNGPGADLNQMQELLERGNQSGLPARGYGVQNVHQRIKLAFGNDYGLNYEQILNGGTRVTIKIPKLTI
jgi:two-component system sensor histidine kinase YesM